MRTLMWFAVGFGAAIAAGVYFLSGWCLLGIAAAALCSAVILFLMKRKTCRISVMFLTEN